MKFRRITETVLSALAAALFLCGCAGTATGTVVPAETADAAASPAITAATDTDIYLSDANSLIETLEQTHPLFIDEPYPEKYLEAKQAFLQTASGTCDADTFKLAVSKYLNSLNDAHTAASGASKGLTGRYVQLRCAAQGDELFLLDEGGALTNAHVTTVCGVSAAAIYSVIDAYFSAENDTALDANHTKLALNQSILTLAGCVFEDDKADVTIEENGQTRQESVEFGSTALLRRGYSGRASATFETEDGIAVFDLNSCTDDGAFRAALRKLNAALGDGVTKVIIDVRDNPGGDSSVCATLLETLGMSVPTYGMLVRFSPLADEQRGYGQGSGAYVSEPSLDGAQKNDDISLCVLTNDGTFSSATMLAVWTQDGKLGTVVGYPSANAPSSYGDIIYYTLPETDISVTISHKKFLRPDANANQTTLEPDVLVPYGEDALPVAEALLNG